MFNIFFNYNNSFDTTVYVPLLSKHAFNMHLWEFNNKGARAKKMAQVSPFNKSTVVHTAVTHGDSLWHLSKLGCLEI